jgi:hypothetical protein
MDDFFADMDKHIERFGGAWAAYLVRALWDHPGGLSREQVIDAVLEDALARGRPTPRSLESTLQSTFQQHNSASSMFRRKAEDDILEFVGGKGSGTWRLRRPRALAWMATNARACDFELVRDQ